MKSKRFYDKNTGITRWYNYKHEMHREDDLPAYESIDCNIWAIHNNYHRENGPAMIYKNGKENWCLNGIRYYPYPDRMPLNLFLAYVKWEYKKNLKSTGEC